MRPTRPRSPVPADPSRPPSPNLKGTPRCVDSFHLHARERVMTVTIAMEDPEYGNVGNLQVEAGDDGLVHLTVFEAGSLENVEIEVVLGPNDAFTLARALRDASFTVVRA